MTNEELVKEIQNGRNDLTGELCVQNKGIVVMMANRLKNAGEFEDVLQESYLALLEAAQTYNPEKDTSFSTWLTMMITYRIYRHFTGIIRIPEQIRGQIRKYKHFIELFEKETGREPTDEEIRLHCFFSEDELSITRSAMIDCCSLQAPAGEDSEAMLQDLIRSDVDMAGDVLEDVYQDELRTAIWKEVDALPEDESAVIREKYQNGKNTSKVSNTIPGARYKEAKALRKLRKSKRLQMFYEDIRSEGMKGTSVKNFNNTWTSATERTAFRDMGIDY